MPFIEHSYFSVPCKKNNVSMKGYPVSNYNKENSTVVISSGFVEGRKEDIKNYYNDLKKDKRTLNMEYKDNFLTVESEMHILNSLLFQPSVMYIKPAFMNNKGEYFFELGSWDKKKLEKIIKDYEIFKPKLLSLKKEKMTNIQTFSVHPNLTDKQKACFDLANEQGYYDYPRKITLKELAKLAKISYSTFQFHLQNAEKKVMPYMNKLIKM